MVKIITAKEILDKELSKHGCRFTDDWKTKQYVIEAMEKYAKIKKSRQKLPI